MVEPDPHRQWKILGEEPVVQTPWFQVGLADVELPGGRRIDHYLFRLPPVVLTAMQDDQDRVLLILRYRFIPGTWGWELPSGLADPTEDFAAAAARETLKETGWEPESPELLLRLEASAGLTDSVHHVYLASRATRRGEPGYETVRMEWFALGDMPAMIASGEIRAASTSAAVLMIGRATGSDLKDGSAKVKLPLCTRPASAGHPGPQEATLQCMDIAGSQGASGATAAWSTDELERIGGAEELQIAAERADGTLGRAAPIWVVSADGQVYVRTWYRRDSGWFGQVVGSGRARIRVPGLEAGIAIEDVGDDDGELRATVDAAYRDKYGRYGETTVQRMVTDDAAAATLRLVPQQGARPDERG